MRILDWKNEQTLLVYIIDWAIFGACFLLVLIHADLSSALASPSLLKITSQALTENEVWI